MTSIIFDGVDLDDIDWDNLPPESRKVIPCRVEGTDRYLSIPVTLNGTQYWLDWDKSLLGTFETLAQGRANLETLSKQKGYEGGQWVVADLEMYMGTVIALHKIASDNPASQDSLVGRLIAMMNIDLNEVMTTSTTIRYKGFPDDDTITNMKTFREANLPRETKEIRQFGDVATAAFGYFPQEIADAFFWMTDKPLFWRESGDNDAHCLLTIGYDNQLTITNRPLDYSRGRMRAARMREIQ